MDAELKQYLEEMEARQRAELERVETNLLREFWKWRSTSGIRTRQSMENTNALNERMLNAGDRISVLERGSIPRAQTPPELPARKASPEFPVRLALV